MLTAALLVTEITSLFLSVQTSLNLLCRDAGRMREQSIVDRCPVPELESFRIALHGGDSDLRDEGAALEGAIRQIGALVEALEYKGVLGFVYADLREQTDQLISAIPEPEPEPEPEPDPHEGYPYIAVLDTWLKTSRKQADELSRKYKCLVPQGTVLYFTYQIPEPQELHQWVHLAEPYDGCHLSEGYIFLTHFKIPGRN